jgi:apolipoprotein N-acyltransferase
VTLTETNPRIMPIMRIAHAIVLAWGWRRAAIAFSAGAVSVLALAPFDLWPMLWLAFPVMVWLVDGAAAGRLGGVFSAAVAGWWFGLGYFTAGLYWLGYAFLVDAQTFAWLMPFAVLGLPAGLAFFTALGFALARLLWTRGPTRLIALAVALTIPTTVSTRRSPGSRYCSAQLCLPQWPATERCVWR